MQNVSKTTVIISILAAAIITCGLLVYYIVLPWQAQKKADATVALLEQGRGLLNSRSTDAVSALEQVVAQASDPTTKGNAERDLGVSYLLAGQVAKGLDLLKSISANAQYPIATRQAAAAAVLDWYLSSATNDPVRKGIFVGPVWGDFLIGTSTDAAARRASEWGNSLAPGMSPLLPYWLAQWSLSDAKKATTTAAKTVAITQAQTYFREGDAGYTNLRTQYPVLGNASPTSEDAANLTVFSYAARGEALQLRAWVISMFYELKVAGFDRTMVKSAFTDVAGQYQKSDSVAGKSGLLYTDLIYAAFLERNSPSTAEQKSITEMLGFIASSASDPALANDQFYTVDLPWFVTSAPASSKVVLKQFEKLSPQFATLVATLKK